MASLTESQAGLLSWIAENGGIAIYGRFFGREPDQLLVPPAGPERPIDGTDLRELEAQGLMRKTAGDGYEITNEGRMVHERLKNPPPEPPPVGFRPS